MLGGAIVAGVIPILEIHVFRNGMGVNTGVMLPYLILRGALWLKPFTVCIVLPLIYAVPVGGTIRLWFSRRRAGAIALVILIVAYLAATAFVWRLPLD